MADNMCIAPMASLLADESKFTLVNTTITIVNRMRYVFIICLLLPFPLLLSQAQTMGLRQCISYALENNPAYINKAIESEITKESYRQSIRNFLPGVSGGSSANKQYGRSIDPTTNTFVNHDFFSMNFYIDPQLEIFQGFTRINRVKFQKLQYLISREEIKQKEIEIAFAIMNQYYDLLYFTGLYDIVQEQVRLSSLNLDKINKMIGLGLKSESDLLEIKAQQATELYQLMMARNQYDLALLSLKSLMNWPVEKELIIENELLDFTIDNLPTTEVIYQSALQHMPTVIKAAFDIEAAGREIDIARGRLAPFLTVGGGLYTNFAELSEMGNSSSMPGNSVGYARSFREQWSQNMAKSIYMSIQIPLFNRWSGISNLKQAKRVKSIAENSEKEEQQRLYRLVSEDIQQYKSLQKEQILLETKRDALAEAYSIAEKKLEQGLISVIEFYTAKNQLAQSENEWVRTVLQIKVKEKTIRFYLGEDYF